MNGYTKKFLQDKTFIEAGVTLIGKIYAITFYLPGDVVDADQKYFIKDGEDVDTIASKAYYEKQLSYIKTIQEKEKVEEEIQEPKPFSQFTNLKEFKTESVENKAMLKDGEVPVVEMPLSPEDAIKAK
jgi:hypothetical protein